MKISVERFSAVVEIVPSVSFGGAVPISVTKSVAAVTASAVAVMMVVLPSNSVKIEKWFKSLL